MISDSLVKYIKNQNAKNIPKELIISKLIEVGWRIEDIEEAIAVAIPSKITTEQTPASSSSSLLNEVSMKNYGTDPYKESVSTSSESPLISIRGSQKIEFIKDEPNIDTQNIDIKTQKIWTPSAIKPIEEDKKEVTKPIINPVSTTKIETFQQEINQPQHPPVEVSANQVNPVNSVSSETNKTEPLFQKKEVEIIPTIKPKTAIEELEEKQVTDSLIQKKNIDTTKDMSKIAMISSYSHDYISANKLKQNISNRKKRSILKTLIFILIIFILGGISFSFAKGYIKIPGLNLSFFGNNSKEIIIENFSKFNSLKFYKVETEAKITIPSLTDIASSLVSGQANNSNKEDYFSFLSKGEISKIDEDSKFYDYSIVLESSIFEDKIKTNIKNNGEVMFIDIPNLSSIFEGSPFINETVVLPVEKIEDIFVILPDSFSDNKDQTDILKIIFGNLIKNNPNDSFASFNSSVNNVEIIKNGEESINNINTYKYTVVLDKVILSDFINKSSFVLFNNLNEEDKKSFNDIWSSVYLKSFDIWVGKEDNNLYQYKFSLAIPLSKLIGEEDISIVDREIIIDWRKTYSDFDVPNSVIMPIEPINFDSFLTMVKDQKIEKTLSSFFQSAEMIKDVLGNYGLKSNTTGSCDDPVPGSLFSATGHNQKAINEVTIVSDIMKRIIGQTNGESSCYSNSKAWAISTPLPSDSTKHFCVDSTGNSLVLEKPITKTSCK